MTFVPRARLVNPRLGTYFGIFASAFAGLFFMLLILEQLGAADDTLRWAMLVGPLVLYAAIGVASFTRSPLEYFAAGRRVPAVYAGLGLAVTAMGATGLVAFTGLFFLIGFDALCLVFGGLGGFVAMATLLAPFLRKIGTFTVPSYLGRRFESRALRVTAAALLAVPMLLVLAAELRMGAYAAGWLTGRPEGMMIGLLVLALLVALSLGGMRSLAWSSVAQAIAMALALMVPVAIFATITTNLPLPQLTHGPVLRGLVRAEVVQGVPLPVASPLSFGLPGEGLMPIAKRYAAPFGIVGPLAFFFATLTIMAGIAAAPWLLPRVATTPGVYEARKSLGWATLFFGVIMLTISGVAVFMRDVISDMTMATGATKAPEWFAELRALGIADVDQGSTRLAVTSLSFRRDGILFGLPVAGQMPAVLLYLVISSAVAAALAACGAVVTALAQVVAEDIINGLSWEPPSDSVRLGIAQGTLGVTAALGGMVALAAPTDPLRLLLWSLASTASAAFPVLVLSVWWKRINAFGAMAGLIAGFAVAILAILGSEAHRLAVDSALAGAFGIPAGIIATLAVSLATPRPDRSLLDLVHEIRSPGGEIVYDREMRLLRLRKHQRT